LTIGPLALTKLFHHFTPGEEFVIPDEYFEINPHLERKIEEERLYEEFYKI
jgi:hypothetical protein